MSKLYGLYQCPLMRFLGNDIQTGLKVPYYTVFHQFHTAVQQHCVRYALPQTNLRS